MKGGPDVKRSPSMTGTLSNCTSPRRKSSQNTSLKFPTVYHEGKKGRKGGIGDVQWKKVVEGSNMEEIKTVAVKKE